MKTSSHFNLSSSEQDLRDCDGIKDKTSIFLGVTEICGILEKLFRAYSRQGIDASVYCFETNDMFNPVDNTDSLYKSVFRVHRKISNIGKRWSLLKRVLQLEEAFLIIAFFFNVIRKHSCFVYVYARGIFSINPVLKNVSEIEFWVLKLLRKRVVVWCCGSDSRPPYCGRFGDDYTKLEKATREISKRIHIIEKYTMMIDNPASAHFHENPYINYSYIGNLIEKEELDGINKSEHEIYHNRNNKIRILHAPSTAKYKGTDIIRREIKELVDEGFPIEYVELTGVAHEVVIDELSKSDILVNEMYSDFPMSMLDAEAAMLGVSFITCGYYAEYYKNDLKPLVPPSVFCLPNQLRERLKELITDEDYRKQHINSCKRFVEENWLSDVVAKRLLKVLYNECPKDYLYDPSQCDYIWGWGSSVEETTGKINYIIARYGLKGLQLKRKKRLIEAYSDIYMNSMETKE